MLPFVGASGQEPPHEAVVLVQMLDRESIVWAWPLEHFFEVVRSALRGLPTTLAVSSGHGRALTPLLLVLPFGRTMGGAFAGALVPPCLAIETIEDCSDRFFTLGMAGGDVKEFLGGSRALASQLMNQRLVGSPG